MTPNYRKLLGREEPNSKATALSDGLVNLSWFLGSINEVSMTYKFQEHHLV